MDGGYQPEHGGFEPGRVRGRPSRSEWKQVSFDAQTWKAYIWTTIANIE